MTEWCLECGLHRHCEPAGWSNPWPRAGRPALDCHVAVATRNDGAVSGVRLTSSLRTRRVKQSMAPGWPASAGLPRRWRDSQW